MSTPPQYPADPPPPQGEPPPQHYVQQQRTNGFAVASLVLGILWIFWVGSVLALVFGFLGKSQIEGSGGAQGGLGLAIAGIVLGSIGVVMLVLVLVFGDINFYYSSS